MKNGSTERFVFGRARSAAQTAAGHNTAGRDQNPPQYGGIR